MLHIAIAAVLGVSLVTGLGIGVDAAASDIDHSIRPWLLENDAARWHAAAGLCAAASGVLCWVWTRAPLPGHGSARTGAQDPPAPPARLRRLKEQALQLLYPILMLLGVTGSLMVSGIDVGPSVTALFIELHLVAAWALACVLALYLACSHPRGLLMPSRPRRGGQEAPTSLPVAAWRLTPTELVASTRDLRAFSTKASTFAQQLRMYVAGCACFALGVKCLIDADLGADPLHAMTLGIVARIDLPYVGVGLADSLVTLVLLLIWTAWNRRLPPITIFITMALVGYMVDLCNALDLHLWTTVVLPPTLLMALGLVLDAYGSALIIMSGIGIRVVDLVAITVTERLRCRFYAAKLALEALFFASAWLVGGPLGLATVGFLIVVGPFMEPMMQANHRLLGLPNYGLRPNRVAQR